MIPGYKGVDHAGPLWSCLRLKGMGMIFTHPERSIFLIILAQGRDILVKIAPMGSESLCGTGGPSKILGHGGGGKFECAVERRVQQHGQSNCHAIGVMLYFLCTFGTIRPTNTDFAQSMRYQSYFNRMRRATLGDAPSKE
jgi:hypothetical protein